jgi:hypothetical protein
MSMSERDQDHRLTIRRGGQAYRGRWHVAQDEVHVSSPYGRASAPPGAEPPRAMAETLLGQIAFLWTAAGRA